jgi:hypothetical protein
VGSIIDRLKETRYTTLRFNHLHGANLANSSGHDDGYPEEINDFITGMTNKGGRNNS